MGRGAEKHGSSEFRVASGGVWRKITLAFTAKDAEDAKEKRPLAVG